MVLSNVSISFGRTGQSIGSQQIHSVQDTIGLLNRSVLVDTTKQIGIQKSSMISHTQDLISTTNSDESLKEEK